MSFTARYMSTAGCRMLNSLRATNPLFSGEPLTRTSLSRSSLSLSSTTPRRPVHINLGNMNNKGGNNYGRSSRFGKPQLMILGGGGALFGMYYVAHLETVPISGRRRMIDVSPEKELEMGVTAWEDVKQQYSGSILPNSDPRVQLVRKIAQPIIEVSGLQKLDWEIIVVNEDQANAFVLPGGKICVFTGIMKIADDPNELATVLSHEIGHVVARHNAEHWSFARVLFVGGNVVRIFVGDVIPDSLLNYLMYFGMELPFSRKCENEADHIGLLLMSQACYDPEKAVGLWSKFQQLQGQSPELLKYASTHPSHADRVKNIQELLPQAENVRSQSHCENFRSSFRKHHAI